MNQWTAFDKKWGLPPMPPAKEPVFMLASIWRSGSTLVQRLLCSDPQIFLWGEPYGDAGIVPHLHHSAKGLLRKEWPTKNHFLDPKDPLFQPLIDEPHKYWIANVYPQPQAIRDSYRSMLDTLFLKPAIELGKERFGIKEVRYDGNVAQFLHWLYPDARFVFLIRNPYDAWSSYKGAVWYYQWPKMLVKDVGVFAKLWRNNVESFLNFPNDPHNPWARLFLFEDIIQNQDKNVALLEEHCRVSIKRETFDIQIRGMQKPSMPVNTHEESIIRRICGNLAEPLGYIGPKNTVLT
jgi:hypothetical protein